MVPGGLWNFLCPFFSESEATEPQPELLGPLGRLQILGGGRKKNRHDRCIGNDINNSRGSVLRESARETGSRHAVMMGSKTDGMAGNHLSTPLIVVLTICGSSASNRLGDRCSAFCLQAKAVRAFVPFVIFRCRLSPSAVPGVPTLLRKPVRELPSNLRPLLIRRP